MSTLLLLTSALQPSAEVLPGLALLGHQVKILPAEGSALLDAPDVRPDPRRRPPGARPRPRPVPPAPHHRHRLPGPARRHRGRPGRRRPRLGHGRRRAAHLRPGRARGADPARRSAGCAPRATRPTSDDHVIRSGEVVVDDATYTAHDRRARARPDVQGVRAAEVPRPAPRPGLHPRPAAAGGLGLRLLRRHPHRRRPRTPAARQARARARDPDRHRPQRRLPVRAAGQGDRAAGDAAAAPTTSPRSGRR